jgi:undecaprenyl-phosphate 4-deoxy-4-formamido-L-arabinose transferase
MAIINKARDFQSLSIKKPIELSVLIPVYNEEDVLEDLKRRLMPVLEEITHNFEIIFIDDGSRDNSAAIIKSFYEEDRRLKGIKFARNFGQHAALSAGLRYARGSKIVTMDADLQNPPEEIPKLLNGLSNGHDLVWGKFESRHHSYFRKAGSAFAKYILSKMMRGVQTNISTFRAIDGTLVENLNELNEQSRFLDGLLIWLGANPKAIVVKHAPRAKGKTKYTFFRLIRLWFDLLKRMGSDHGRTPPIKALAQKQGRF